MHKLIAIAGLNLLLLAGCDSFEPPVDLHEIVDVDPVTAAGDIAARIDADPSRADSILAEHDITPEEWDTLIYEIASDPDKTAAFEAARH